MIRRGSTRRGALQGLLPTLSSLNARRRDWSSTPSECRRIPLGISALLAAFASLVIAAITASPAFADRTYDSQITGFGNPQGLAIDGGGDVWIDDYGSGGLISEYDAYPSQTLLGTQNGGGHHGGYILSIALNNADGHLYVADSGPVVVDVYESGLGSFTEEWKTKNSCGTDRVAVDNSSGPSNGRVYIARSCDGVTAFVGNHTEAPFSASGQPGKTYISGNELTGTPSGNFGGHSECCHRYPG